MNIRVTAVSGGLLLAIGACQPAQPAALSDADKAAIDSLEQNFARLAMVRPVDSLVRMYYADDATVLPPNAPAATGHPAILALLNSYPPFAAFQIRPQEINGAGNMAWVQGRYSMVLAPPNAAAIADSGKYLEIWRKEPDGKWKNIRDMFSSDVPLPMPDTTKAPRKKGQ